MSESRGYPSFIATKGGHRLSSAEVKLSYTIANPVSVGQPRRLGNIGFPDLLGRSFMRSPKGKQSEKISSCILSLLEVRYKNEKEYD